MKSPSSCLALSKRVVRLIVMYLHWIACPPFELRGPVACFSKVPKLFEPISGATIPFISSQRRGSKLSNFAILLVFPTLKKHVKRSVFQKKRDRVSQHAFPEQISPITTPIFDKIIASGQEEIKRQRLRIVESWNSSVIVNFRSRSL